MDPNITAAIVSGVFAITASIVTLLLKEYIEDIDKLPISKVVEELPISRVGHDVLNGIWGGTACQYQVPNCMSLPLNFPVLLEFSAGRKRISGVLTIGVELSLPYDSYNAEFDCTGGFYYGSFLQLNYMARDKSTMQFGSVILKLSGCGNILEGRFAGYGKITEDIVSGTVRLKRGFNPLVKP